MHYSRMLTDRLLTVSRHALMAEVYLPGRYLPRGCTYLGGGPTGGVPVQGGVPAQGVYLPRYSPCEQNDRQVQKYYLAPNFVCGQ